MYWDQHNDVTPLPPRSVGPPRSAASRVLLSMVHASAARSFQAEKIDGRHPSPPPSSLNLISPILRCHVSQWSRGKSLPLATPRCSSMQYAGFMRDNEKDYVLKMTLQQLSRCTAPPPLIEHEGKRAYYGHHSVNVTFKKKLSKNFEPPTSQSQKGSKLLGTIRTDSTTYPSPISEQGAGSGVVVRLSESIDLEAQSGKCYFKDQCRLPPSILGLILNFPPFLENRSRRDSGPFIAENSSNKHLLISRVIELLYSLFIQTYNVDLDLKAYPLKSRLLLRNPFDYDSFNLLTFWISLTVNVDLLKLKNDLRNAVNNYRAPDDSLLETLILPTWHVAQLVSIPKGARLLASITAVLPFQNAALIIVLWLLGLTQTDSARGNHHHQYQQQWGSYSRRNSIESKQSVKITLPVLAEALLSSLAPSQHCEWCCRSCLGDLVNDSMKSEDYFGFQGERHEAEDHENQKEILTQIFQHVMKFKNLVGVA